MIIEKVKEQAVAFVEQCEVLQMVYALEQPAIESIIENAIQMPPDVGHWQAYEQLKKQAKKIVGFNAQHDELATPAHYSVMMDFLNWLLNEKRYTAIESGEEE